MNISDNQGFNHTSNGWLWYKNLVIPTLRIQIPNLEDDEKI